MISKDTEAQILRLHSAENWPPGTIAFQLGLHHSVVQRVISEAGTPKAVCLRPSMVDPYMPFVLETLKQYPKLHASRLYRMACQRGYPGQSSHFRSLVARVRPKPPAEAYLRLKTLPGEQCQVDWGHFGKLQMGKALRPLMAFVMVLSYSRAIYLKFFLGQQLSNFLRGYEAAFRAWGGVPRVALVDNLKSAVLERRGDAIHFHPTILQFSSHWRFEVRPVAVARGNEKGRVERAIRFIRENFFAARKFQDLEDLNRQAQAWCEDEALGRPWPEGPSQKVRDAFFEEKDKLLPLAATAFPTEERLEVAVGKTPYVRFDLNDYSVPHELVRKTLVVSADLTSVRILDGMEVVATHQRSFDKGAQLEDPSHIAGLEAEKKKARKSRGMDRLCHAAPCCEELFKELAARGANLGSAVVKLLELLDAYGQAELEAAIKEALENRVPHPHAVLQSLERRRQAQGKLAALPLDLPQDPRVRNIVVKPHSLDTYDQLKEISGHEPTETTQP